MGKITDLEKWRAEINLSEDARADEFGEYTKESRTKAGENIDYYEKGFYESLDLEDTMITTVNIVDAIVSIIVPSLYFKNPRTICVPNKIESEDSAPVAAKILDHYRKKSSAAEVNRRVIWDAYLLGYGVSKVGYVTKFGKDIDDDEIDRKPKSLLDKGLEKLGLKKKVEEEVIRPDIDQRIIAESPFIEYISPFDFIMDVRARSIEEAMWWGHRVRKTVKEMKSNKKYKNTDNLKGAEVESRMFDFDKVTQSEIGAFETVDLYEVHYRNENKFYILVISCDGAGDWREHYHDESIYEIGEWQCNLLSFKKHSHKQYPRSDISKIKNLQDRITSTIDAILEQVDRFLPKIAYETGAITPTGLNNLENGGIGAIVECNKNPMEIFKELSFTQVKADLQVLIDQLISLISIQTGLTKAQLTGLSDSGSATEATIEQGGQNIRMSDMRQAVQDYVNKQTTKLWKVIKQFVDLEDIELINGVKGINPETGLPMYDWLTVSPDMRERLINGDYDFDIEVGSTEKVDLAVVRKAFENLFNILARSEVIVLMQQQGQKVELATLLKKYIDLFPELSIDSSKLVQQITPQTTGLIPPPVDEGGGTTGGSNFNQLEAQAAEPVPTLGNQVNEIY